MADPARRIPMSPDELALGCADPMALRHKPPLPTQSSDVGGLQEPDLRLQLVSLDQDRFGASLPCVAVEGRRYRPGDHMIATKSLY
jgi:hypothetical protein